MAISYPNRPKADFQYSERRTTDSNWRPLISSVAGPGDVSGTRQTGELLFKLADLNHHGHLLDEVATVADTVMRQQPAIRDALIARWIGHQEHFVHV
jgi:RecG-like helicase